MPSGDTVQKTDEIIQYFKILLQVTRVELHELISPNKGQKGCLTEVAHMLKAGSMLKIEFTKHPLCFSVRHRHHYFHFIHCCPFRSFKPILFTLKTISHV